MANLRLPDLAPWNFRQKLPTDDFTRIHVEPDITATTVDRLDLEKKIICLLAVGVPATVAALNLTVIRLVTRLVFDQSQRFDFVEFFLDGNFSPEQWNIIAATGLRDGAVTAAIFGLTALYEIHHEMTR